MGKRNLKALFIIQNTAQAEMLKPITEELLAWDSMAINVHRWQHRTDIEKVLRTLNFPYETIGSLNEKAVRHNIQQINPDIVIVGNDDSSETRMFIKYANSLNIPTLLIQDGIISRTNKAKETFKLNYIAQYIFSFPSRIINFVIAKNLTLRLKIEIILYELQFGAKWKKNGRGMFPGSGECLKMAVFGDDTKNLFLAERVDPQRIVVTGNPKFDALNNCNLDSCKNKVYQKWGISSEKLIVLVVTSYFVEAGYWTSEQRKHFVTSIASATASLANTQLIIKVHPPLEKEESYKTFTDKLKPSPIICSFESFSELVNACSILITVSSTAALEAMAINKPVVLVNLFNDDLSFYKESGALFAVKIDEILPAIKTALFDTQVKKQLEEAENKFVYNQAFLQDGKATKRIAELIRRMVKADKVKK